jgi:hypothetical protein
LLPRSLSYRPVNHHNWKLELAPYRCSAPHSPSLGPSFDSAAGRRVSQSDCEVVAPGKNPIDLIWGVPTEEPVSSVTQGRQATLCLGCALTLPRNCVESTADSAQARNLLKIARRAGEVKLAAGERLRDSSPLHSGDAAETSCGGSPPLPFAPSFLEGRRDLEARPSNRSCRMAADICVSCSQLLHLGLRK